MVGVFLPLFYFFYVLFLFFNIEHTFDKKRLGVNHHTCILPGDTIEGFIYEILYTIPTFNMLHLRLVSSIEEHAGERMTWSNTAPGALLWFVSLLVETSFCQGRDCDFACVYLAWMVVCWNLFLAGCSFIISFLCFRCVLVVCCHL